jgi:glycosyltransferase involved in cell wall biosynthesis
MKIGLFDHHDYPYPTNGIGGIVGLNELLFNELGVLGWDVTLICTDKSTITPRFDNQDVIKLPHSVLEDIRWGRVEVEDYFEGDIFHTHTSSTHHCDFNFNSEMKWVATCHGCQEWAGATNQVFVSHNQYLQHKRDGLLESLIKRAFVVNGCANEEDYYYEEGTHDKLVWIGRIDGAKAERLLQVAPLINEDIYVAGDATPEWQWLKDAILALPNIKYVGYISGEKAKREFFSTAKASLHLSTFEDPFPVSVIEAQHCGIPVITWANGSMFESNYTSNNVFHNKEYFVNYINNELYKTCCDFKKISRWSHNKFSAFNYAENYIDVFEEVLNPKVIYVN